MSLFLGVFLEVCIDPFEIRCRGLQNLTILAAVSILSYEIFEFKRGELLI